MYVKRAAVGGPVFNWLARLADRCAPAVLAVAVFGFSVAAEQGFLGPVPPAEQAAVLVCCALCGLAAGLARWRLWPLFTIAAVAGVALLVWPATLVAAYYAGTTLRHRRLLAFVAVATGCFALSVAINALSGGYRAVWAGPVNATIQLILFLGLPLTVGLWISARRQLLIQLRDRADRLEREQAARAEQARTVERARIAREMHDILAHRVSLMVLHAGAIEVHTADAKLAAEAGLIRTTGRDALTDLRAVLGVLRAPASPAPTAPQPVLADLDDLVAASGAAGVPVTRRVEGDPVPLPETVQRTAYRVVQEALTNVHKHAGPAATELTLRYEPDRLVVAVRNAPPDAPPAAPAESGFGLAGLRERVSLLGGDCAAGPDPDGGFTVRAELPAASA